MPTLVRVGLIRSVEGLHTPPPLIKGNSPCFTTLKLEHQLFLAFGLILKYGLLQSLEPARLWTETRPSALLVTRRTDRFTDSETGTRCVTGAAGPRPSRAAAASTGLQSYVPVWSQRVSHLGVGLTSQMPLPALNSTGPSQPPPWAPKLPQGHFFPGRLSSDCCCGGYRRGPVFCHLADVAF